MRKILIAIAALGGFAGAGATVQAAPVLRAPVLDNPAQVQAVQYREDGWREREHWRQRREEEVRRREEWRRRQAWRHHEEGRGRRAYGERY